MTALLETVRLAAGALAADIADARKVRVLCPRGHHIVDLVVITLRDGLVLTAPLSALDCAEFAGDLAALADAAPHRAPRGKRGLAKQSGSRIGVHTRGEVVLECPRSKCDPRRNRAYRGAFDYYSLSADIGAAAYRHAEYQLTN